MGIADVFKELFSLRDPRTPPSDLSMTTESQPYDYTTSISYRLDNLEKINSLVLGDISKILRRISDLEEIIKKGADNSDSQEV